jgi:hypothetical protein
MPQIKQKIKRILQVLLTLGRKSLPVIKTVCLRIAHFFRHSWKSIALIAPLVIFAYYVIGGSVSNKIDKSTDFEITQSGNAHGLALVDASAALIYREVDDHIWTPNLPIIFPGYVLDNMPAFQTGIIRAERVLAHKLKKYFDSRDLEQAVDLLDYPTNVWLLSKTKNLALAPSSGAQYRKARQQLLRFNADLDKTHVDPRLLPDLLETFAHKFGKIEDTVARHVQEESSAWIDLKADDVFYNVQGRLYAYYVFLKALAVDFESAIVDADQYHQWTSMMKNLEDALALEPSIVRNGAPDSSFAPNHLLVLDDYVAKARYRLTDLTHALKRTKPDVH